MLLSINNRDPRPIYEQVRAALRRMIITGAIAQDERLPSVRELAQQLAINPNTIQRAYRELELEGWLYSVPGKGNFAGAGEDAAAARIAELKARLRETAREMRLLGADEETLAECLREEAAEL